MTNGHSIKKLASALVIWRSCVADRYHWRMVECEMNKHRLRSVVRERAANHGWV